jgi:MraZ protein
VDEKGRLVLPPVFRRELEAEGRPSVVLAPHQDGCVMLMRPADFATAAEDMKGSRSTPEGRETFRYFTSHAQQLEVDKAGRINLSEEFRDFAGIAAGTEAALVGFYDYAEIWSRDRYLANDARAGARFVVEVGR